MSFEQKPANKKQNSLARNSGAPAESRKQNSLGDNDLYWKILEQKKKEQEQTQRETVVLVEKKTPWALIICLCILCTAVLCCGAFFLGRSMDSGEPAGKPGASSANDSIFQEQTSAGEQQETNRGNYKIAMISDYGNIDDQSYNQATWEAVEKFGLDYNVPTCYYLSDSYDHATSVAVVELAIAEGNNVIVLPGYSFGSVIAELSREYPDVKFVGLDISKSDLLEMGIALKGEAYDYNPDNWELTDYVHMDNVYCTTYREELAGYMAGYAAVKLGYTKLGFLGGMSVPAVQRYGYGFVQGVDAAAAELGIQAELNYIYGNQYFADAAITSLMETWYADGTEVVFACGGGIYNSAAEAAQKVGGKVIGTDVDQAATIDGMYGNGITLTSAMKGLAYTTTVTLYDIIINGKWDQYAGRMECLGLVSGDDPARNHVHLGTTLFQSGKFTEADYATLVRALFEGVRKVSRDISSMPATTNTKVNDLGVYWH